MGRKTQDHTHIYICTSMQTHTTKTSFPWKGHMSCHVSVSRSRPAALSVRVRHQPPQPQTAQRCDGVRPRSYEAACSRGSQGTARRARGTGRAQGTGSSMAQVTVRDLLLVVGVALIVLGVCTTMRTATVVNITAVFEEEDFEDFQAVFYRTLNDFNNASKDIRWFGHAVVANQDVKETISAVCNLMEGRRSSLHVLIVFGNVSTIQTMNMLSQTLGIPMMGYMTNKGDGYIQVSSSYFFLLHSTFIFIAYSKHANIFKIITSYDIIYI